MDFFWFNVVLAIMFASYVFLSVWRIQNALSESVELARQQLKTQNETNTLMRELIAQLRGRQ
ncbi:MAG TPA: hypothetical protein VMR25_17185 [Planctomycetaceae bacterium]|jgi:hypothetical protein|nr:hypothetical protein [Planctomycetaceae bacterium]